MNIEYHILSNLELLNKRGLPKFESQDIIYLQSSPHNHFGRFYNPEKLKKRIYDNAIQKGLSVTILDFCFPNSKYSIGTNLGLLLQK